MYGFFSVVTLTQPAAFFHMINTEWSWIKYSIGIGIMLKVLALVLVLNILKRCPALEMLLQYIILTAEPMKTWAWTRCTGKEQNSCVTVMNENRALKFKWWSDRIWSIFLLCKWGNPQSLSECWWVILCVAAAAAAAEWLAFTKHPT